MSTFTYQDAIDVKDMLEETRGSLLWTWHTELSDYGNAIEVAISIVIHDVQHRNMWTYVESVTPVPEGIRADKRMLLRWIANSAGTYLMTWMDGVVTEKL